MSNQPMSLPKPTAATYLSGATTKGRLLNILPLLALLGLVIFFAVRAEAFLGSRNLLVMSGQIGILLSISLGATMVIVAGSTDLSVGSVILLTGAIVSQLIVGGMHSPILVVLTALAIGSAAGFLNGALFTFGRIPSFIVTLGTLSFYSGLGLTILNGRSIYFDAPGVLSLAIGQSVPNVQNSALI
jgi:ribose transport system permease protein